MAHRINHSGIKAALYGGGSVLALTLALNGPVLAQTAANTVSTDSAETVVVTSSRIVTNGYNAPTPTTVVSTADIQAQAEPNIFTTINLLPSLAGSTSTATGNGGVSGGTNGLDSFAARGLGTGRTLTLLDGERVVSPLLTDVVDVNQLPQGLVQRVDVVTGGASASWGSDAVAGVVNFVLNKKYSGLKVSIAGGSSNYNDDKSVETQITGGTDFANSKAHFEFNIEYLNNSGVPQGIGSRPWYQGTKILTNPIASTPAGTPQLIVANNVVDFQVAPGGIITAGPLKGITFGPGGQPFNYNYGSTQISPFMIGGDQSSEMGKTHSGIDAALARGSVYGRFSYDITPTITANVTALLGETHTFVTSIANQYKTASLTIQCGNAAGGPNAFLPASVNTACIANNITSFQYGTFDKDFQSVNGHGLDTVTTRTLHRVSAGLDGTFTIFGSDYVWKAYAAHGWNDSIQKLPNTSITPRYNVAIDAVVQNGKIVCRSAAAQADGCVPLDIIGTGVASQEALNYVLATPFIRTENREENAGFNFSGSPISDWAGPVSVAAGAEYREEGFTQQTDCVSVGNCGGNAILSAAGNNLFAGNFHPGTGNYHVSEAFLETAVPLLKDATWGDADLSLGGRATGYSAAGYVSTWKVGLTYEPGLIDGLKFRALLSRDVRAPALGDLFAAPSAAVQTVIDDFAPNAGNQFTIQRETLGNKALHPEKASTKEVGIVYQPQWLPGFSASVDYYRVGIKGGIASLGNQQQMDLCFQGSAQYCSSIIRNSAGIVTTIIGEEFNLAFTTTDGFDLESSYQGDLSDIFPGMDGGYILRALATHVSKFQNNTGVPAAITSETAGNNSGSIPLWHVLGTQSVNTGPYALTLTERYISAGVLSVSNIQCLTTCPVPTTNNATINNNQLPSAFYMDVGGSFDITDKFQAFFKVDNLMNLNPAIVPTTSMFGNATNPALYDVIGRTYHIGLRFND